MLNKSSSKDVTHNELTLLMNSRMTLHPNIWSLTFSLSHVFYHLFRWIIFNNEAKVDFLYLLLWLSHPLSVILKAFWIKPTTNLIQSLSKDCSSYHNILLLSLIPFPHSNLLKLTYGLFLLPIIPFYFTNFFPNCPIEASFLTTTL